MVILILIDPPSKNTSQQFGETIPQRIINFILQIKNGNNKPKKMPDKLEWMAVIPTQLSRLLPAYTT